MKLIRLKNRKKEPASAYTTTDTVFDARNRTLTSLINAINKAIDNVKAALSGKANASDLSKKADKTLVIPYDELTYAKVKTAIEAGRNVIVAANKGEVFTLLGLNEQMGYMFANFSYDRLAHISVSEDDEVHISEFVLGTKSRWDSKADDSKVVHLNGKETISGTKTFNTLRAKDFSVLNSEDKGFYVSAIGYDDDDENMITELYGTEGDEPVVLRNIGEPSHVTDAATKGYVDGTVKTLSDKLDAIYEKLGLS